jgi:hypothetical protein
MATDLLNPHIDTPSAAALSAELSRLDTAESDDLFGDAGPLSFTGTGYGASGTRARNGRKFAVGVAALLAVAAAGLILATKIGGGANHAASINPTPTVTATSHQPAAQNHVIPVSSIRIVDPKGDGTELSGASAMIDGRTSTDWHTQSYNSADFGGVSYKPGMGVLLDLGEETQVDSIKVEFAEPGATIDARLGDTDPGTGHTGDTEVFNTFTKTSAGAVTDAPPTTVISVGAKTRYVLLWMTEMPRISSGKFRVGIQEITVNGS